MFTAAGAALRPETAAFALAAALSVAGAAMPSAAADDARDWPAECTVKSMPAAGPGFQGLAAPLASLVAAAAAEGRLVIYSGISETATMDNIVAEFRKAYPALAVTWTTAGGGSQRLAKFLAEAEAGLPGADIITEYTERFFRDAFDKGYLVSLDDAIQGFSTTWPKNLVWTTKSGLTGAFTFSPFGFAYNVDVVPKDMAPKSWEDLADPRFKGHIQIKDVNASPNTAQHFQFLRETLGDGKFRAFAANLNVTPLFADAQIMAQILGAGGAWVMPQAQPNVIDAIAKDGAPVKSIVPGTVGGSEYAVGLRARAAHPNAAALFAYWTYGAAGQWVTACAMRSGSPVFPGYGPRKFVSYKPVTAEQLADLNKIMGIRP